MCFIKGWRCIPACFNTLALPFPTNESVGEYHGLSKLGMSPALTQTSPREIEHDGSHICLGGPSAYRTVKPQLEVLRPQRIFVLCIFLAALLIVLSQQVSHQSQTELPS